MKTKIYHFKVTLNGMGETPEEAWHDAGVMFSMDSGEMPEEYEVEEVEDE
jgi:hypothetical protein